jgi:hypothetical protein
MGQGGEVRGHYAGVTDDSPLREIAGPAPNGPWHLCDIAISRMDFRFRGKSGHAADISAMNRV